MRLLYSACRWGRLSGSLRRQLLSGSLSSCRLTGCLLRSGHCWERCGSGGDEGAERSGKRSTGESGDDATAFYTQLQIPAHAAGSRDASASSLSRGSRIPRALSLLTKQSVSTDDCASALPSSPARLPPRPLLLDTGAQMLTLLPSAARVPCTAAHSTRDEECTCFSTSEPVLHCRKLSCFRAMIPAAGT